MQIQQNDRPHAADDDGGLAGGGRALHADRLAVAGRGGGARAASAAGVSASDNLTRNASGVLAGGGLRAPVARDLPWEVDMGIAYQLGPRPLNPGWENPHEQEACIRQQIVDHRAERALLREADLALLSPEEQRAREPQLDAEEARCERSRTRSSRARSKRLYEQRKARYDNWPREKILLLASVLLTGASNNAVSLQGFLDQQVETVGRASP